MNEATRPDLETRIFGFDPLGGIMTVIIPFAFLIAKICGFDLITIGLGIVLYVPTIAFLWFVIKAAYICFYVETRKSTKPVKAAPIVIAPKPRAEVKVGVKASVEAEAYDGLSNGTMWLMFAAIVGMLIAAYVQ